MATTVSDDQPWVDPVAIDIDNLLAEDKTRFEIYQLKLEVLGCFLELLNVNKARWKTFCDEIATQPPDSTSPYLENFYENDGSYSFPTPESMQSHLITDAFFIVGLFIWSRKRKLIQKQKSGSDEQPRFLRRLKQIFYRGSLGSSVHALDLDICWLYEGQIPLFLLKNAWERVAEAARSVVEIGSFTTALKKNLFRTLMYSGLAFDVKGCGDSDFKFCDHLLACVHKAIIGGEGEGDDDSDDESSDDEEEEEDVDSLYRKENEAPHVSLLPKENAATFIDPVVKAEDKKDQVSVNGEEKKDREHTKDESESGESEKDEENVESDGDEEDEDDTEESQQKEGCFKSFRSKHPIGTQILEFVRTSIRKVVGESDHYTRLTLPSATQLAGTGIRFKMHNGLTNEVTFEKSFFRLSATLYLPRIYVADFTETMLLNLCVYESMNRQDEGVHNCVMLMDELIDTEADVELLMDGKDPIITENRLGDNKQVVGIFTNPVKNLYFLKGDNYNKYAIVRDDMIVWYNNPWRRRVVQFLDSYRVAPWLVVSLLAAILLLVLTVVQTIYTIWGFYKA
ncbi:hypothetical protein R1sor_008619 [Riccia sorocarpa]|uniref:Uncharacterized protein n=1 Tax=Riccia sorocarpa TaxID=122646 RepID=A0ABD3HTZ5_9MARC